MSTLRSASIEGLWDGRTITIDFDPRVNFLIGANGSGKTTVLNLIASALSSDYESLTRTEFTRLKCVLAGSKQSKPTNVTVTRESKEELARVVYAYSIEQDGETKRFQLVSPTPRYGLPLSLRTRQRSGQLVFEDESSPLNDFVKIKWLTVHRASTKTRGEERHVSESSVDRKLTSLSNQLVRYFSKLASQREMETSRFLKQILGSLVYSDSDVDPFTRATAVNLPEVQVSIEALVDTFLTGTAAKKVRDRLTKQFELASLAQEEKPNYGLREVLALAAVLPMQSITEEWTNTQRKQEVIARPRTEFLETINSMYTGKRLSLNQRNELEVDLPSGKHLSLSELSSGEKQLLIIFAEALLQEKIEFIYMADEPELSLHVRWQEQLTRNLLRINPKAQIIFATHSPDVVSEFGDKAISMEDLNMVASFV